VQCNKFTYLTERRRRGWEVLVWRRRWFSTGWLSHVDRWRLWSDVQTPRIQRLRWWRWRHRWRHQWVPGRRRRPLFRLTADPVSTPVR